jgi:hypothetical protein
LHGSNTNISSTNNASFNDSDKKDSSAQSVSSKPSGGNGSGSAQQRERTARGSRQNQPTNEREKEHLSGKSSRRERRGEQSSKFSQTS